jgi:ketosteroid isomerase-like protein
VTPTKLPPIIQQYVDASNAHEVKAILSYFSNDALVRDEEKEYRGKAAIENWIVTTIEKYEFRFKPLGVKPDESDVIVTMEVSGSFPGSPVTPDYHFAIKTDKIASLVIN